MPWILPLKRAASDVTFLELYLADRRRYRIRSASERALLESNACNNMVATQGAGPGMSAGDASGSTTHEEVPPTPPSTAPSSPTEARPSLDLPARPFVNEPSPPSGSTLLSASMPQQFARQVAIYLIPIVLEAYLLHKASELLPPIPPPVSYNLLPLETFMVASMSLESGLSCAVYESQDLTPPPAHYSTSTDAALAVVHTSFSLATEELSLVHKCFYTTDITYKPSPLNHLGVTSKGSLMRVGIDTGSGVTWLLEKGFHRLVNRRYISETGGFQDGYETLRWPKAQELTSSQHPRALDWTHNLGERVKPGAPTQSSNTQGYIDGDTFYMCPIHSTVAGDLVISGNEASPANAALFVARAVSDSFLKNKPAIDGILGLSPYYTPREKGLSTMSLRPLIHQLRDGALIENLEFHWWHPRSKGEPHLILGALPASYKAVTTELSPWLEIMCTPSAATPPNRSGPGEEEDEEDDEEDDEEAYNKKTGGVQENSADKEVGDKEVSYEDEEEEELREYSKWILQLTEVRIEQPSEPTVEWFPSTREQEQPSVPISFDTAAYCTFLPDDLMSLLTRVLDLLAVETADGKNFMVVKRPASDLKDIRLIFRFQGAQRDGFFEYEMLGSECIDKHDGIRGLHNPKKYQGSVLQAVSQFGGSRCIWGVRGFRGMVASFRPHDTSDPSIVPTIRLGNVPNIPTAILKRNYTTLTGEKRKADTFASEEDDEARLVRPRTAADPQP